MAAQSTIIQSLPEVSWRNLAPVPCSSASYEFSHNQSKRQYPYRDGAGHDWTGRDAIQMSFTLLFYNTLEPHLYPGTWEYWRQELLNGTSGDLVHPDLGKIRARVTHAAPKIVAERTDGISVEVTFTETVDDLDKPSEILGNNVSTAAVAEAADAAMEDLGFTYPDGESDLSIFDAISSIEGQLFSASLTVGGKITQVMGTIDTILDNVRAADDTVNWPLEDMLLILREALDTQQAELAKNSRPVGTQIVTAPTTLDAFATLVSNKLDDVIALNLALVRSPLVPVGTEIRYYLAS